MDHTDIRGAGGTSGGIGMFFFGLGMAIAGAYLLTQQVEVTSGFWRLWGYNAFGLSLEELIARASGLANQAEPLVGNGAADARRMLPIMLRLD